MLAHVMDTDRFGTAIRLGDRGFDGDGLKGQCHEILDFWFFFHESVSPQPLALSIP
jgi:hypothetical protein